MKKPNEDIGAEIADLERYVEEMNVECMLREQEILRTFTQFTSGEKRDTFRPLRSAGGKNTTRCISRYSEEYFC